jgi:SAM-dependent methyltransferase
VRRRDGATIVSNPRTRTHAELEDGAIPPLLALADGAEEAEWAAGLAGAGGWDRTHLAVAEGLWSDQTGLGPRRAEAPVRGAELLALLRRRMLVHRADRADYDAYLAPLRSILDRAHLGTFHERVGQFQALELRLDEKWRWWHDQKFEADGRAVKPGPYKFVQETFFDAYYGRRPPAGRTVLDFACGNGYYANKFAALGATVTGIDTDRNLIDLAVRNFGRRARFFAPASNEESFAIIGALEPGSIDLIYMSDVMLLLADAALRETGKPELDRLLELFRRALAPGGRIEMMEPSSPFWLGGIYGDPARPYVIVPEYRERIFNVAPTLDQYVALFAEHGFALAQLLHPPVPPEHANDPSLRGRTAGFPLWDFMTFVALGERGASPPAP